MTVDMQPTGSGTTLALHLSGVPKGERCKLIAVSDSGVREDAGWWEVGYSGQATIRGTTSITRPHLSRLVIKTDDGRRLVAADVPSA
jgi:hypothetical protein